jgi:hypothetical protein
VADDVDFSGGVSINMKGQGMRFLSIMFKRNAKPRRQIDSRRRLGFESLEDRSLLSVVISPSTDPGSTISSAYNLGPISNTSRYIANQSESSSDKTDYYKFTIPVNEPVNVSLTGFKQNLNLEVRNSTGALIVNSNASGTTAESLNRTLAGGTYYVDVTYNASIPVSTNYTLTMSAGSNWKMISGINNEVHHVGVIRADGSTGIICAADSWLLIHGRNCGPSFFGGSGGLANAVASSTSGSGVPYSQVLEVDWETVTNKGLLDFNNPWIIKAGDAIAGILSSYSITGSHLNEIGHSWGALLGYEIGRALGGGNAVNRLVALDPACQATGYDSGRVNFGAVSTWSWEFTSSSLSTTLGGISRVATADESFTVRNGTGAGEIGNDIDAHTNVVAFYADILFRSDSITSQFKLSQVKNRNLPWKLNQYDQSGSRNSNGVFEAVLCATQQSGIWKLSSCRYVSA